MPFDSTTSNKFEKLNAALKGRKWTVRKRKWPTGTPYFIVMRGDAYAGQVLISDNGSESRWPSKEMAQHYANEHNKELTDD